MQEGLSNKDRLKTVDGKRIRVGPVPKTEISSSMGMTHKYVWGVLVHKNKAVMKRIVAMGYRKNSRFVSRRVATFLAKHFDLYIDGVSEDAIADSES